MESVTLLGIDLAKNVFQLHGLDELGRTKLKRTLRRRALVIVKAIKNRTVE